jgi:RHS repeat-associated protein
VMYAPYGDQYDPNGSAMNPVLFAGNSSDLFTGLYDTPNRELSVVGRWESVDPAHASWNGYAYVTDPTIGNDPTGLFGYVYNNGGIANGDGICDGNVCDATGIDMQSRWNGGAGLGGCNTANMSCAHSPAQNIAAQIRSAGTISEHVGGDFDLGVRITYDKNVPEMEPATKEYVENVTLSAVGIDSINISATTNGEHAPNSNHYNGTAVDINKVDDKRVINAGTNSSVTANVSSIQDAANSPKNGVAHENYGPAGLWKDGRAINNPTLQAQHENHIHITIPRDDQ